MLPEYSEFMTKKPILPVFLLLFVLFSACKENKKPQPNEVYLDSLADRCFDQLMQLQTDSLRITAQLYLKATEPYGRRYYKARQFYINSFFNAKAYDKVLLLLDETAKMPGFNEYPVIVCDYQYTRARTYQFQQKYQQAINAFKVCMTADYKDEKVREEFQPTILATMTQLMNTFIIAGRVEEGYHYYMHLRDNPTAAIRRFAMRDLYTHLCYLAKKADYVDEAYRLADSIFVLPLCKPTPERLFRDYTYASFVIFNKPGAQEKVINWLKKAMLEAEKYDYTAGVEWCIDLLATYYWQMGRIGEATELHFKAIGSVQKRGDKVGECNIYNSMCMQYIEWELYAQANYFAELAMKVAGATDDNCFKGLSVKSKGDVMRAVNRPDSALFFYKKAEQYFAKAGEIATNRVVEANIGEILIDHHSGDSLSKGVRLLRNVLISTNTDENRSYLFFVLAKGLIKQGNVLEGEAMLDSMYRVTELIPNFLYKDGVLEYVLDHYQARGNPSKIVRYAAKYRKQMDVRFNENISRKVTSALIKYQTEKKEQQLKLVTAELSVKELRIQLYVALLILLLLLLMGGYLWYLHKRKLHRNRQRMAEQDKLIALRERELIEVRMQEQAQQLTNAIDHLRDANRRSEQVQEQLDEFLSDRENKQSIASLTPSLFRDEGEVKFRRYFTQLYPGFIAGLKEQFPAISRSEEILCMLIALDQNMDQISDILCIEKKSVKMSRYRLRKKLQLEQEESLDALIKANLHS